MAPTNTFDLVILGGGLAGLSLARQLLLQTNLRVLLVEKRSELPPKNQKVGESTVQLGGYYLSKVLDLEEELLSNHLMKYNLRFYWKSAKSKALEDYSQAYIRKFSNIASYQVDRNALERTLLQLNQASDRFSIRLNATAQITLGPPHTLKFTDGSQIKTPWLVDATGRQAFLSRTIPNEAPRPTAHAASFAWVDGLVNIDKLNSLSPSENRKKTTRPHTGHLPVWLATNHFMGEGFWFWVIPLQGKTSLGLVFDKTRLQLDQVNTPEKLLNWAANEFPLFAKDFRTRRILGGTCLQETGLGRKQMMHPQAWAISGDAGRFLDPLYSPGTDFIAIQNTLITQAVQLPSNELAQYCLLAESLNKAYFDAFVPSFHTSYDGLGDQETFVLKYTWELSVYFTFYVFPFINEFTTQPSFILPFLKRFSQLGPINHNLHSFLSAFFQWKKSNTAVPSTPHHHELTDLEPLAFAETLFYSVGISDTQALTLLDTHLESLTTFAHFILVHLTARVLGDASLRLKPSFVRGIDPTTWSFDPKAFQKLASQAKAEPTSHTWPLAKEVLDPFWGPSSTKKAA